MAKSFTVQVGDFVEHPLANGKVGEVIQVVPGLCMDDGNKLTVHIEGGGKVGTIFCSEAWVKVLHPVRKI